jgi:hypothetical protein
MKFRNFVQGDLLVTKYCRRLKKMADDLTALGEAVTDRTIVLNILRGLNERFTHVGALLRRVCPFPTFLQVKDDLSLEELTLGSCPPSPPAALAATTTIERWERHQLQTQPPQQTRRRGWQWQWGQRGRWGQQRLHAAIATATGWRRQDRQPPPRRLAHRLQLLNGHHTAVVRCPPSSSGTHTSTVAAAAAGVHRPTTTSAPVAATAVPASFYSSWCI